jgi:hypothetical protein
MAAAISREIRPPSWMRRGPVLALGKRAGHHLVLRENANHERPKPLLRSDWTIYRGGAVFVNNDNRRIRIAGCDIHERG